MDDRHGFRDVPEQFGAGSTYDPDVPSGEDFLVTSAPSEVTQVQPLRTLPGRVRADLVAVALLACLVILIVTDAISGIEMSGSHFEHYSEKFAKVVLVSTGWTDPAVLAVFLLAPLLLLWLVGERTSLTSGPPDGELSAPPLGFAVAFAFNVDLVLALLTIVAGILRIVPWAKAPSSTVRPLDASTFLGQGLVACVLGVLALFVAIAISSSESST